LGLLTITVTRDGQDPVVALSGEADLTTVPELAAALAAQIDAGARCLTVDLSGLLFLDSASVGALITASRGLEARGGTLKLAYPRRGVARTLDLLALDQVIPIRRRAVARAESGPDD
jgi:stage II sporulation protein AA (anti-sigma F factor antagonist)